MWDLPKLVMIQKARNALRDGRLDEAFEIATEKRLRDHRQCQVLLEKLVDPLLQRGRKHLAAGRREDALADVQRAQEAGGNRPETAALREDVLAAMNDARTRERAERRAVDSARRHLDDGRLDRVSERLRDGPADEAGEAVELRRRLEARRADADEARERAAEHLEGGEIERAVEAMGALRSIAAGDPETRRLTDRILAEGGRAVADDFAKGELSRARRLLGALDGVEASSDLQEWRDALDLCAKGSAAMSRGDWSGLRVYLGRLRRLAPSARWVTAAEKQSKLLDETLRELRAGPLGEFASGVLAGEGPGFDEAVTCTLRNRKADRAEESPVAAQAPDERSMGSRFLLWVDGVATFLLLKSDTVTIGRAGSSRHPDIELAADLEGVHAQILRVDHDYFLVPRGPVAVGGSNVERHLLADGDEIVLGSRSRMTFRQESSLSTTALLELGSGLRLEGDVRKVILLDGHLIFGDGGGAHLQVPRSSGRVILSFEKDALRCRSPVPLVVDGKVVDKDAPIPLGSHVEAGELTFTLTAVSTKGKRK